MELFVLLPRNRFWQSDSGIRSSDKQATRKCAGCWNSLRSKVRDEQPDQKGSEMFIIRRRQNQYGRTLSFVAGVAVGSRLMYLVDPVPGKRRRMVVRDKGGLVRGFCSRALANALRDPGNRAGVFLPPA